VVNDEPAARRYVGFDAFVSRFVPGIARSGGHYSQIRRTFWLILRVHCCYLRAADAPVALMRITGADCRRLAARGGLAGCQRGWRDVVVEVGKSVRVVGVHC